jgi:hypothetical protein
MSSLMAFAIFICLMNLALGSEKNKWAFDANGFGLRHEQVFKWVWDFVCLKEF